MTVGVHKDQFAAVLEERDALAAENAKLREALTAIEAQADRMARSSGQQDIPPDLVAAALDLLAPLARAALGGAA